MNKNVKIKAGLLLGLMLLTSICINAKSVEFKVLEGCLDVLLEKKTAIYEIDYSQLIVTDTKHPENDMNFASWMQAQDEDNDKWTTDWETKDKAKCNKAFREKFNDEIENGLRLSKLGKDYKVIMHLTLIDFGPSVKYGFGGIQGGESKANGIFEVRDFNTNEVKLKLEFNRLKGESSFRQIGRLIGLFENFGEQLNEYLEDYQKEQKKSKKK